MEQLDIFADSRDVMLRNDVLERLQLRDAVAARAALAELACAYPDDAGLPAMTVLVNELQCAGSAPFADHAALAIAVRRLENEVTPAAAHVLPAQTVRAWLAPCWRSLAKRAAPLPFRNAHAEHHATPLWLLVGDWAAAHEAVEGIDSWWRIPSPLAWMAEARCRVDGLDAAWPLIVELAWLAPARFAALLPRLGDASLDALRRRFDAEFPGMGEVEDYSWFPAWLLVVKPALSGRLGDARTQPGLAASRAAALLGELLRREHEGDQHKLVSLRQRLSRLHAGLFRAYMATRKVQHR
ncbi:hypothetical protein [Paraburkholderia humisilvae]|uniref:Uncharacterized protein n=1 Tax=Paraburkholderia humisilvae TaxID=627669 RepID=A0A6J5FAE6_9BURK|nr:hypothetical protein [Paraburkholderia humisilvae]CAB3774185.1 hypothetical protein LMG29542_07633 [Paraburkholderia humisilvae]